MVSLLDLLVRCVVPLSFWFILSVQKRGEKNPGNATKSQNATKKRQHWTCYVDPGSISLLLRCDSGLGLI